jgi:hypothetical protein
MSWGGDGYQVGAVPAIGVLREFYATGMRWATGEAALRPVPELAVKRRTAAKAKRTRQG